MPQGGRFVPGTAPDQRQTGPRDGSGAAFRAGLHLRERAVARSPAGGDAVGAAAQAARECPRSALAHARELHGRRTSRVGPRLPLRDEQVDRHGDRLVGRSARTAAERGCGYGGSSDAASCAGHRCECERDAARGDAIAARQTLRAGRHTHSGLHLVPGVGWRHALPERLWRREPQGRVEEPPGHAPGRQWRRSADGRRARRLPRRCRA